MTDRRCRTAYDPDGTVLCDETDTEDVILRFLAPDGSVTSQSVVPLCEQHRTAANIESIRAYLEGDITEN